LLVRDRVLEQADGDGEDPAAEDRKSEPPGQHAVQDRSGEIKGTQTVSASAGGDVSAGQGAPGQRSVHAVVDGQ
jgi:hypothetical protein